MIISIIFNSKLSIINYYHHSTIQLNCSILFLVYQDYSILNYIIPIIKITTKRNYFLLKIKLNIDIYLPKIINNNKKLRI